MSIPTPASKPKATRELIEKLLPTNRKRVTVVAVRAYRSETMGKPGNDVNMYDDAFFIVTQEHFSAWNGNTDPTRYGWNPNADKYMARLKLGHYMFIRRMHRGKYLAFGQGENLVTVQRIKSDGSVAMEEEGLFGIDLHKGGVNGTSSEGCLTLPASDWPAFDKTLSGLLNPKESFSLILVEGPIC